jgi:hypothetical protein
MWWPGLNSSRTDMKIVIGQTQVPQSSSQEETQVGEHEVDHQHCRKDNGDGVVGE